MNKDVSGAVYSLDGRFKFLWVDETGVHLSYNKMMAKGDRTIPFHQIVSVEVKKPGAYNGYIYFQTAGSPAKGQMTEKDIAEDDNAVIFLGSDKYETALKIQQYIEQKQCGPVSSVPYPQENRNFSAADEIIKFKQLLDSGIITKEEFEAKKRELLNIPQAEETKPAPAPAARRTQQPAAPVRLQKKRMNGCLFAFILTVSLVTGIIILTAVVVAITSGPEKAQSSAVVSSSEEIRTLFDAPAVGGKTVEELKALSGACSESLPFQIPCLHQ